MNDTLILSDTHLIHQWDTPDSIERKERAIACIATHAQGMRQKLRVFFNGDILHRPDDPLREGFRPLEAERAIAPLIDVLHAKEAEVHYLPGNCDSWAGPEEFHDRIKKLLDPRGLLQEVECQYVYDDEELLVLHGHIIEPSPLTILREAMPFMKPHANHRRRGEKIMDALKNPDPVFADRMAGEWGGSHYHAYLIHASIDACMSRMPKKAQQWMTDWKEGAWSRSYSKAAAYGASVMPDVPKVVALGHTHVPVLLEEEELRELMGEHCPLPQVLLNTGTATGDRGRPATFASISRNMVSLWETDSPSRRAVSERKSAFILS